MRRPAQAALAFASLAAGLAAATAWLGALSALSSGSFPNGANTFTTDTLEPPTGLTATSGASILLNWTATADTYASGYRILRGTASGGPYSQIAEVTPRTTTAYTDTTVTGGTTYFYVARSFYQSWESANSNEASATAPGSPGSLNLQTNFTMSTATSPTGNLDIKTGTTEYFTASSGVTSASNSSDWTVVLVQRDRPTTASSATITIWWRNGGACSSGAVSGQIFATASVTVPVAVSLKGVSLTVSKTAGTVSRTFVAGDLLCMSVQNPGTAGANNFHNHANTASTSGTTGVSRLQGSFTQ